jgi:hypothetical protein
MLPLARRNKLIIRELPDEVLIYDSERDKAHCLNQASALVWKHCDGKTSIEKLRMLLQRQFATPIEEDVVWLALDQLRRFHLLEEEERRTILPMTVTRRDLVRKYLPAALALPVIMSISSPVAAQVASCRQLGQACTLSSQCCSGCCTGGTCQVISAC